MKWLFALIFLFLTFAAPARAAEDAAAPAPTVEETLPDGRLEHGSDQIVTLVVENDLFGGGTDRNYTSGVRLTWMDASSDFPRLAYVIDRLVPTFKIGKTTALYYSLGQNLYTPRDITRSAFDPLDRPWAGFLYGSIGMATLRGDRLDEVEGTLGVVGPAALGEPVQKFIHKHISNSPTPRGWDHQLKNEPGLILAWQRSWPMLVHGDIGNNFWSLKPYAGVTAGNIYTYADVGIGVRLSPADSKWQDTPLRVRPALPGTGIYEVPKNKWSWAVFGGIEGRAVARDIFLDGNSFTSSHNIGKRHFVADANAGVALTLGPYRVSYTVVYRTKQFDGQSDPEIFGAISGSVRF